MSQQPKVFKKNYLDLDYGSISISITDSVATNTGQNFVDFMRNRNNTSGWMTTGSTDAANTEIDVTIGNTREIDTIIIVGNNFKNYKIENWNGSAFVDFSTPINITDNTETTNEHFIGAQDVTRFKITVNSTQTADADKRISQLIATRKVGNGQFIGWPEFDNSRIDFQKKTTKTLSGKVHLKESIGGFSTRLRFRAWPKEAHDDFTMLEYMYYREKLGFLFWPSGGDDTQFTSKRRLFKKEEIYLCRCTNQFQLEWYKNLYSSGLNMNVDIEEVI